MSEAEIFMKLAVFVIGGRESLHEDDCSAAFQCLSEFDRSLIFSLAILLEKTAYFRYFRESVNSQIYANVLDDPRLSEIILPPTPETHKAKLMMKLRAEFPTFPINFAIALGKRVSVVESLLSCTNTSSIIDFQDIARGWTTLHYAIAFDHEGSIIENFLYHLNLKPGQHMTLGPEPLNIMQFALKHEENVKTLIKWYRSLKSSDIDQMTRQLPFAKFRESPRISVIHFAAQLGSLDFVKFYTESLAQDPKDMNIVDDNNWGILHHAVYHNQIHIINYLLQESPFSRKMSKAIKSAALVKDEVIPGSTAYDIAVLKFGKSSEAARLLKFRMFSV